MEQFLYRIITIAVLLLTIPLTHHNAYSQDAEKNEKEASEEKVKKKDAHKLDEIVVTANRYEERVFNTSLPVNVINREDIEKKVPRSLEAVFRGQAGVDTSRTSMGSIRPMIRGLYGERVLILVDGIRLSELMGSSSHAISIDPSQIERIEVVRGPNSVLYGSDAIGGVINIITRKYKYENEKEFRFGGSLEGSYDSAVNGWTGTGYLDGGYGGFNAFAGGKYKYTDNVQTPHGDLRNSFLRDNYNVNGGVNYTGEKFHVGVHGYFMQSDIGIPQFNTGTYSEFYNSYFDNEKHYAMFINAEAENLSKLVKEIKLDGAFQRHNRHMKARPVPWAGPDIFLDIDTWNLNPQVVLEAGKLMRITVGANTLLEEVTSERYLSLVRASGVIPDARRYGFGIYIQDQIFIHERVVATLGFRYDWMRSLTKPGFDERLDQHPIGNKAKLDTDFSGNAGLLVSIIKNHLNFTANFGRAFRSPTLLERYFSGPHIGANEIGNPYLHSETAYSADAGLKVNYNWIWFTVNGFYSYIEDYISQYNITATSKSWFNILTAELYGCEGETEIYLPSDFTLFGNISYTHGRNRSQGGSLSSIPPLKGTYGIRYEKMFNDNYTIWGEFTGHSAMTQHRIPPTDFIQFGPVWIKPTTPGYTVLDLNLGFRFKDYISIVLFGKNLTDRSYHDHLSRVWWRNEQPGRNFGGSIKLSYRL